MKKFKKIKLIWVNIAAAPIFIAALIVFRASAEKQFLVLIAAALVYLITAVIHHTKDKSLTLEIAIEYILIATLALIMLQGILFY